jgi:hypothetical protein
MIRRPAGCLGIKPRQTQARPDQAHQQKRRLRKRHCPFRSSLPGNRESACSARDPCPQQIASSDPRKSRRNHNAGIAAVEALSHSQVIHVISSVRRALPVCIRLLTYCCLGANRRFGPQAEVIWTPSGTRRKYGRANRVPVGRFLGEDATLQSPVGTSR